MRKIFARTEEIGMARIKAGYSLRQIANRGKLSHGAYYKIENGTQCPYPETAAKICEALGTDFDSIFRIEVKTDE